MSALNENKVIKTVRAGDLECSYKWIKTPGVYILQPKNCFQLRIENLGNRKNSNSGTNFRSIFPSVKIGSWIGGAFPKREKLFQLGKHPGTEGEQIPKNDLGYISGAYIAIQIKKNSHGTIGNFHF